MRSVLSDVARHLAPQPGALQAPRLIPPTRGFPDQLSLMVACRANSGGTSAPLKPPTASRIATLSTSAASSSVICFSDLRAGRRTEP